MKLGKLLKKRDPRTFQLRALLSTDVETPVSYFPSFDINNINWEMLANDELGDCVEAAQGHALMSWAQTKAIELNITDDMIVKMYSNITGYNGHQNTDNGTVMLDALNYWRKNRLDGRIILAYAEIKPGSQYDLKDSVFVFNGAWRGLELAVSVQGKDVWEVPSKRSAVWGGHCVFAVAYDADYIYFVSWGKIYKMTWQFYSVYCDEAYALISHTYMRDDETINNSIDLKELKKQLENLAA